MTFDLRRCGKFHSEMCCPYCFPLDMAELRWLREVNAELLAALEAQPCQCDMRFVKSCPDCGDNLLVVPQGTRLNEDQWAAVKAGEFYCTGPCRDNTTRSGKRYFRYSQLAQYVYGRPCARCAAIQKARGEQP